MNTLFPIFLKAENLQFLIVGGGNVGLEKLEALLNNAPKTKVLLVAPLVKDEIIALSLKHDITIVRDAFHPKYLKNIDIVIAGTDSKEVNKNVYDECKAHKILVNIADTPAICDFYLGSIVQKDDLKIAISTNGKSPTFAKRFREILQEILPSNIQDILNNLEAIRNKLKGDFAYKIEKLNEITKVMKDQ